MTTPVLAVLGAYAAVLLAVGAIDFKTRFVYPVMVYPATLAALILGPVALGFPIWSGLAGLAVGAGLFGVFFVLANLMYPGKTAFGAGDVMIAAMIGAMVGVERSLPTLLLGSVIGGLGGVAVFIVTRNRKAIMPYGPGLCFAAILNILASLAPAVGAR